MVFAWDRAGRSSEGLRLPCFTHLFGGGGFAWDRAGLWEEGLGLVAACCCLWLLVVACGCLWLPVAARGMRVICTSV